MDTEMFPKADALWAPWTPRKPPPLPWGCPAPSGSPPTRRWLGCAPFAHRFMTRESGRAQNSGAKIACTRVTWWWFGENASAHRVAFPRLAPRNGVLDKRTLLAQCPWFCAGFSHRLLFSFPLGFARRFHAFHLARGFVAFHRDPFFPPN